MVKLGFNTLTTALTQLKQHRQYRSCFILSPFGFFFFFLTVFLHYMAASIKGNVEIGNQYMLLL